MRPTRWIAVALAALLLVGMAGGCVQKAPVKEKVIVVGLQAEPMTLDPHQVTDYNSNRAVDGMFNKLIEFVDGGTDLRPGLAERWDIEDGGLTYIFHLRRGVKFHDGEPFNAEAVKFSIMRQIDPNHPYYDTGEFAYAEFTFGMVDKVEVLDEYKVKITLKEPYAPFLSNLAIQSAGIVSPAAVKKYGRDFSHNPVGTGPFRFVRWEPGVEVVLEKNPDYWDGAPTIDRVIFRPVVEDQARVNALEAGQLNFIVNIPPDDLDRLEKDERFTVMKQAGMHVWYVILNCATKPFNDPRVRQAVNYAIDTRALVDGLLKGTGVLAVSPLPPVVWGHTDQVRRYDYNLERAKQLLAEAGYPDGFTVDFWVPESGSGMQQPVAMGTAIQADLARVGIKAHIQTFEWGTYLDKVLTSDPTKLPPMFELSWIGDNGDPDNFLYILLSGEAWFPSGFNLGFYKNPEVDKLLREARTIPDKQARTERYQQAQKLIMEDAPWVTVDHETQIVVMDRRIKGFVVHPTGVFRFAKVTMD